MYIKTANICIDNITQQKFLESWSGKKSDFKKFDFLDKKKLNIPIRFKGKETNISVNSKVIITENTKGIEITILCDFTKFIVFSIIIGILSSLIILALFYNITFFIFTSVFVSILIFLMYYFKTKKATNNYLNKIKLHH